MARREFKLEELLHPKTLLADLYHRKLPQKGWAGQKTPIEKEFIRLAKATRKAPEALSTRK